MDLRPHYNTDAPWYDPCEETPERRASPRFSCPMRVELSVDAPQGAGRLVGPGRVLDMSGSGVLLETKHRLTPGQSLAITLPTEGRARDICLSRTYDGHAVVQRVMPGEGTRQRAALRFSEDLLHNIELALYIDYLRASSRAETPRPH